MTRGQEMVFEAHERAFRFFDGVCRRGIYDNMKTAVSTVFVGKKRGYNRRFQEMCSHHLVEPVACTPGAGWEKGQVERQVGDVRGRLFVPSPRGGSYAERQQRLQARRPASCLSGRHGRRGNDAVYSRFSSSSGGSRTSISGCSVTSSAGTNAIRMPHPA